MHLLWHCYFGQYTLRVILLCQIRIERIKDALEELTEDRIRLAVRRVFTVRRKQFGNFPNYPLVPLIATVLNDLQKTMAVPWSQLQHDQVREYILDNLDINASLPPE